MYSMAQGNQTPEQYDPSQFGETAGETGEQLPQTNLAQPEAAPSEPTQAEQAPAQQEQQRPMEAVDRDDRVILPHVADDQTDDDQDDADTSQQTDTAQNTAAASSMPAVADDVDVIEKAWVNKAKEIIDSTKDDPHAQEAEFEKLQIEYHKKRYGRDIKAAR